MALPPAVAPTVIWVAKSGVTSVLKLISVTKFEVVFEPEISDPNNEIVGVGGFTNPGIGFWSIIVTIISSLIIGSKLIIFPMIYLYQL